MDARFAPTSDVAFQPAPQRQSATRARIAAVARARTTGGMDSLTKSLRARARVLAIFNKRQGDFETLKAYNDYLERVEELIFNLSEGIDVSATERVLAEYKRENATEIAYINARLKEEGQDGVCAMVGTTTEGDGAAARGVSTTTVVAPVPIPTSAVRRGLESTSLNGFDENTAEGRQMLADAIAKACGFDSRAVAKARCAREAFATIWV